MTHNLRFCAVCRSNRTKTLDILMRSVTISTRKQFGHRGSDSNEGLRIRQMLKLSRSKTQIQKPRLPDGIRIYAISDIHGCADLLQKMFTVIDRDLETIGSMRAIHVFLGDYIDRGPEFLPNDRPPDRTGTKA